MDDKKTFDIDLVYLWVDGNDPKWRAKRDAYIGKPTNGSENCEGRYANHDELKYSLRSIEKYAPWIHKIFIVTDNQVPEWLDTTNPRIQIVDHTEIMPPEALPCFNSSVLEHQFHKIPGLAEHFIYANDDMYLNKPTSPATFFAKDGLPRIRMIRRFMRKFTLFFKEKILRHPLSNYVEIINNAANLVQKEYGTYYECKVHHNIDAFLKSHYTKVREKFDKEITPTLINHMREPNDIHRSIYPYVALAEKKGHLRYVSRSESFRFHIHRQSYYKKFPKYNPIFFCMNDSQHASEADRQKAAALLQEMFPNKSAFEK